MKKIYYITKTDFQLDFALRENVAILPLIAINTIFTPEFKDAVLKSDVLIFTSKNAILSSFEILQRLQDMHLLKHWQNTLKAVLGQGSKEALEHLGFKASFTSTQAYGDIFANELVAYLRDKNPLFLRAKKIASHLPLILRESKIALQELVVYENMELKLENPPFLQQDSIIYFGAPSHIRAFLKNYEWDFSNIALCIGESTKKSAKELLGKEARILQSPKPNNKIALEFARSLC